MKSIFSMLKVFLNAAGKDDFSCHGARMDFIKKPSSTIERNPQ